MKRLTKKLGLIASSIVLASLSSLSHAVGTDAGTSVTNLATLNFQIGGVDQPLIESSEAGNSVPGAGNGAATAFVVDRTLDSTVTAVDTAAVGVAPGANNGTDQTNSIALTFTLTNTGNSTQNFALQAVNTAAPALAGAADSFDPVAGTFLYFLDDGSGVLDAADTAIALDTPAGGTIAVPVLEDIAEDATVTIFVVAQIPGVTPAPGVSGGDVAGISLVAAVAEPTTEIVGVSGTPGALILTDDSAAADDTADVQDVFADSAAIETGVDGSFAFDLAAVVANTNAGDDLVSNGQSSDTSAYIVLAADISVTKTVTTVCDDTNLNVSPNAIPGSVQRYTITVSNAAGAGSSAVLTTLSDVIPVNTALAVLRDYSGAAPGATCADFPAFGGADNEFSAVCTNRPSCATPVFFDQDTDQAIDSDGTAASNTITVCYNNAVAGSPGIDCTTLTPTTTVLPADAGTGEASGELSADQSVIVEFDVIVQ